MRITVKIEDSSVGMYITIPTKWHEHPFLTSHFLVTTEQQIEKLRECGIPEVVMDPERSALPEGYRLPAGNADQNNVSYAEREKMPLLVPEELLSAIQDERLAPEKKAAAVYRHSMVMMESLFDNPTADNIRTAKRGIAHVVDLILREEATSSHLLTITSYDYYTYTHSLNVGIYAISLAKSLFRGSDSHNMHELGAGFFLHDLGKTRINKAVLSKPGKFSPEEQNEMRRHPALGFKILQETGQLSEECRTIVLQHHERYDGTGYPQRLRGDDIHLYGRLCSIADVFDALTSDRPYRQRLVPFEGLKIMKESMLHNFQASLFERFVLLFT
jgi:HD-GYP domain-containing protein (c-di-GMP phosphodiesterase class II)